jgi:uncharacterized membrane protein
MTIRNPILWGLDHIRPISAEALARASARLATPPQATVAMPIVRHIEMADLREALRRGFADYTAGRTDVIMLCLIYPIIGLLLGRFGMGHQVLPLLFPLAAGFALVGPLAAVGLNEMSRQREQRVAVTWKSAFDVLNAPSLGGIIGLGAVLTAVFLFWLVCASLVWRLTLGDVPPASAADFAQQVFATSGGWALILLGISVGFGFAAGVLCMTVVSFPLLLDRHVTMRTAILTSLQVMKTNPKIMFVWGATIAGAVVLGSIPLLIGLAVVLPVLGHATWHLYRRAVV